jgi:hypothetical protein
VSRDVVFAESAFPFKAQSSKSYDMSFAYSEPSTLSISFGVIPPMISSPQASARDSTTTLSSLAEPTLSYHYACKLSHQPPTTIDFTSPSSPSSEVEPA